MKIHVLIFLLLLLSFSNVFSQSKKGFVVTTSGDTISGIVTEKRSKNEEEISVKGADDIKWFSPSQFSSFATSDGKIFEIRMVPGEEGNYQLLRN